MTELEAAQQIIQAAEQAWRADHTGTTSIQFIERYMAIALLRARDLAVDDCYKIVEAWDMQGADTKELILQQISRLKEG